MGQPHTALQPWLRLTSKEPDVNNKPSPPETKACAKPAVDGSLLSAYHQHLNALKRYVMRIIHIENDVDDVVQEAFMRAYKTETGGQLQQPKAYLFRVAKHVALNQMRQKINRPTDYLEDTDTVPGNDATLEDEVLAQERLGIHCAAVAALSPRRRKVYLMRKVYGMSHKDIADSLGITVSTVEAHLVKAYRQCHQHVAASGKPIERYRGSAQPLKEETDRG